MAGTSGKISPWAVAVHLCRTGEWCPREKQKKKNCERRGCGARCRAVAVLVGLGLWQSVDTVVHTDTRSLMESDSEPYVDIVALITGSPGTSTGSSPTKRALPPAAALPPPLDEFSLTLPAVFQTDAKRNQSLSERNKRIRRELDREEERVRHSYSRLIAAQSAVLAELNDNGSGGAVRYLLETHRDQIEELVRTRLAGGEPNRHYYFFKGAKHDGRCRIEIPGVIDIGADYPWQLAPAHYHRLYQKVAESQLEFVEEALRCDDAGLLRAVLPFVEYMRSQRGSPVGDCRFLHWIAQLGGCKQHLEHDDALPTKLVHHAQHLEETLLRAAILMHTATPGHLWWRTYVLVILDYDLVKHHWLLLLQVWVPLIRYVSLAPPVGLSPQQRFHVLWTVHVGSCSPLKLQIANMDESALGADRVRHWLDGLAILRHDRQLSDIVYRVKSLDVLDAFVPSALLQHSLQSLKDRIHGELGRAADDVATRPQQSQHATSALTRLYDAVELVASRVDQTLLWQKDHVRQFYQS